MVRMYSHTYSHYDVENVWLCVLQTTHEQVRTFQTSSEDFNVKFKTEGPTCAGHDLDKGM